MRKSLSHILILGLMANLLSFGYAAKKKIVFQEITVRQGDTLWEISNKYLKDPTKWPDIVKYNDLRGSDPTMALPGSKLRIPIILIKEEYRNAELIKMIPEVRVKRKGALEWKQARKNQTLRYEDSLRTMKGGKAHVRFPSKEVVQINENTYVVLKPEKILQEIELLKGAVRASRAKVIMPHGTVVKPKGSNSDFQAKVRDDDTEVVFVYKGKVDVTAQGKTVTVPEGFGTEVPKFSAPKNPVPLTNFKDFDPKEMAKFLTPPKKKKKKKKKKVKAPSKDFDPFNPKKSKSIKAKNIMKSYTLQLSEDEEFENIVYTDTQPIGTRFDIKKTKLSDKTYYMRVAFTDALGVRGKYSQFSIVTKDTKPPEINNITPTEGQYFTGDESYCDVIGDVKGAAMLSVNEAIVFISPTGRFSKFMTLGPGPNEIVIKASDINGNETIKKRTVHYSKKRRK